ncbi:MAG TPA: hypothetical protein DCZ07_06705 [Alphaproteobacteria bacterium]|nr:hypothetical protein [Alphaproteobacteria bacterium]HBC53206.1 hypothetical protein [Alphaproteobacteria bacterium]
MAVFITLENKRMRRVSLAVLAAGLFAFASPVFADSCPTMIEEVEAALASTELPEEAQAKVEALLEEGTKLEEQGENDKCVEVLNQAQEVLGM